MCGRGRLHARFAAWAAEALSRRQRAAKKRFFAMQLACGMRRAWFAGPLLLACVLLVCCLCVSALADAFVPLPTLSPTHPAPRGLLTRPRLHYRLLTLRPGAY